MDDGVAGSIIWFVILLLLEMMFYGFDSALQNMKALDKEEPDKEAAGGAGRKQLRLAYLT